MITKSTVSKALRKLSDPARAKSSAWFFQAEPDPASPDKTGYGYGDKFLGVTVPEQRKIARKYRDLSLTETIRLLKSPYHEERLTAVFIFVDQYRRGDEQSREKIAKEYMTIRRFVNNWDIVDSSAPYILGDYLFNRPKGILFKLAKSKSVWDRRIAVLAAGGFVRKGRYTETLRLAKMLLTDKHDLIHKAVGWMLRVVGDADRGVEEKFLKQYAAIMPRTMLRYAIEKFPEAKRKKYLTAR